jgi:hypothetical protein
MLALDSKGNLYLSPNARALWIQAQYPTAASDAAQSPVVAYGATRVYVAPGFSSDPVAVLSTPTGLYLVNFSYASVSTPNVTESQLQFGDNVFMDATNITPPAPPGGSGPSSVYAFAFGPNGTMYASNGDEIYTSQDNGTNWTVLYYAASPVQTIALSPTFASDNTMMFSTATGVFLSTGASILRRQN